MRSKSKTARCAIACACVVSFLLTVDSARAASPAVHVPRLVVLLIVDQLPAAYLERFAPHFGDDGFRRLVREGRLFSDARYAHNTTSTAPGHAVIGSGRYGLDSGIVGNLWFSVDRDALVYSADGPVSAADPTRCATAGASAASAPVPRNPCFLEARSLARRIKSRWPGARVIGASLKDRPAILALGEGADCVYWFEDARFVSSTFYRPDARRLARMNGAVLPRYGAAVDSPAEEDPATFAWQFGLAKPRGEVCPDDDVSAHADPFGLRRTFPHRIPSLGALAYTPLGNELLADFARSVIGEWNLGKNPVGEPDLLLVGFSSADHVGHLFGPDSCEVADMMARLDRTLAELLRFLDQRMGRRETLVLLTSDHGVATVPEVARRRGLPGGRVNLEDGGATTIGKLPRARRDLERALAADLGTAISDDTPIDRAVVRAFAEPFVYLNRAKATAAELPALRARVKARLARTPGVREAWTFEDIRDGRAPESVRLGYRADRSGDLVVILEPGFIFDAASLPLATSHGQPYEYDAQVPVIFWGGGVAPATVRERVNMARVAPTVAALLDLDGKGFAIPQALPLSAAH